MLIKGGAYSTLTVSTNDAKIVVEPGSTFSGAIELSGDNVTLVLGAGCAMSGLVTISGNNCSLICENGVDLVGVLVTGNFGYVNGGGWDTLSNGGTAQWGVSFSGGDDGIVENIAVQTTAGGASGVGGIRMLAARITVNKVKVIDSDSPGIVGNSADCVVTNCLILGADDDGISVDGPRNRIIGNMIADVGARGIHLEGSADDSTVIGNVVYNPVGDSIEIQATNENAVVVGNRFDGAVDDNSSTSTVANNDETAF